MRALYPAVAMLTALSLLQGCRGASRSSPASPAAAPQSVALPGSSTAADAPHAPAVAESAAAEGTTVYSDPETGVSFRYPSTWRPRRSDSEMYAPSFTEVAGPAKMTQVFTPQGTALAKTNLVGTSFSYTVKDGLDVAACARLSVESTGGGGAQGKPETISGVTYQRGEGSDAGMCHQMSFVVNTVLRGGRCFIFERDLETVCPEVRGPGNPVALTAAQTAALHAELDRVMSRVTLR